jgi:hypothetical protein
MNLSHRSYLTAGVAALSAGAIALAPVQPLPSGPDLSPTLRSTLAVDLAAAIDPITPWIDTFQAAADNISGLVNTWGEQPLPVVQQIVANLGTYISELPAIGTIIEQAVANVGNAARAPFAADLNTLDPAHTGIYNLLPTVAPDLPQGLLDFLTTSTSGLIIGLLGPVLSPVLALGSSIRSAVGALQTSDWAGALNALINIPAAMVNAFLNGGPTIDVTSLLAPSVPAPSVLNSATITLGGLLSQGASIFNAVALDASVKLGPLAPAIPVNVPAGPPAGVFGSLIAMTNAIAGAIVVTPPAPAASPARSASAVAAPETTSAAATEAAAPRISPRANRAAIANGADTADTADAANTADKSDNVDKADKADRKRSTAGRSAARAAASRSASAS